MLDSNINKLDSMEMEVDLADLLKVSAKKDYKQFVVVLVSLSHSDDDISNHVRSLSADQAQQLLTALS